MDVRFCDSRCDHATLTTLDLNDASDRDTVRGSESLYPPWLQHTWSTYTSTQTARHHGRVREGRQPYVSALGLHWSTVHSATKPVTLVLRMFTYSTASGVQKHYAVSLRMPMPMPARQPDHSRDSNDSLHITSKCYMTWIHMTSRFM